MKEILKILRIEQDGVTIETKEKEIKTLNVKLPKFAKVGDFIRHCEHSFYDVVDKNGEIISR
jgi:hypothetical protein